MSNYIQPSIQRKVKILLSILIIVFVVYLIFGDVDFNLVKLITVDVLKYSIPTLLLAVATAFLLSLIKSETVKNIIGMFILFLATLLSPIWVRKTTFHHQLVIVIVAFEFVIVGIIADRFIKKRRKHN